jgi:quinol monooxygenase YgiN
VAVRGYALESAAAGAQSEPPPRPEPVAPELARLLPESRGRVMETLRYHIPPADRPAFLAAMAEVELVRRRAGAVAWRLYEDVAHPERWLEVWAMESWTDHLREESRLSDADLAVLARARALHAGDAPCATERYLLVNPHPG